VKEPGRLGFRCETTADARSDRAPRSGLCPCGPRRFVGGLSGRRAFRPGFTRSFAADAHTLPRVSTVFFLSEFHLVFFAMTTTPSDSGSFRIFSRPRFARRFSFTFASLVLVA